MLTSIAKFNQVAFDLYAIRTIGSSAVTVSVYSVSYSARKGVISCSSSNTYVTVTTIYSSVVLCSMNSLMKILETVL